MNKFEGLLQRIISKRIRFQHQGVVISFYNHTKECIEVSYIYIREGKTIPVTDKVYLSELIEQQILDS
jgi:hypothetical protein